MVKKRTHSSGLVPCKGAKRTYLKPLLSEHGDVATLTQSGSGTSPEGGGGMAGMG